MGQTEKHSARADVFRSSPKNGHWLGTPQNFPKIENADQLLWNLLGESPPKQPLVGRRVAWSLQQHQDRDGLRRRSLLRQEQ
jgi:hypothetical protein